MAELLIELFSEEIPARMQSRAINDFIRLMSDGMADAGLSYGSKSGFITPRRMTLIMTDVAGSSMAKREERKGPRVDAPEKAIEGFMRSTGLTREQLEIRDDKKGQSFFAVIEHPGRPAAEIIAEVLDATIRNFPWPKSMRWGSGRLRWVRPLHSIIAILSEDLESQIIPFEIEGIHAGNTTRGHRFMAPDAITVHNAEEYVDKLTKAKVILDPIKRCEMIRNDAKQSAFALGLELVENEGLLVENAGLTEFPVVYLGQIEAHFRDLPPEVIETSMAEHQKFLSLRDPNSEQISGYVIVSNRETSDEGKTIKAGNAKVLAARLSDAVFFWQNDLRVVQNQGLDAWIQKLNNVTFHNRLGSQGERIARIERLAETLAPIVNASGTDCIKAARVAKSDLSSEMVYEFPELQGIMGRYYAKAAGMDDAVANAAQDHYAPLGPNDDVPTAPVSIAVALADKIDLLTGFWAINEKPTGSKDPFALRRAALGVIRIVIENNLDFSIFPLLIHSLEAHDIVRDQAITLADDLAAFLVARLTVFLRDQGKRHDVIDAGLVDFHSETGGNIQHTVSRINALNNILTVDEGARLQAGIKRALNILAAEEEKDGVSYELAPNRDLMSQDAEKALFDALSKLSAPISKAQSDQDYKTALTLLSQLAPQIDDFFDHVTVNDENSMIRRNRLCLLNLIRDTSDQFANFRKLEG